MSYRFITERVNHQDFASGRVLYNHPGLTSFPVRLAAEVFERSRALLSASGITPPFSLYDPCCGGGYLLTTLGFLYGHDIAQISAADIDEEAIRLAQKNLALLSREGLEQRMTELRRLLSDYGKRSHLEALESAQQLLAMIVERERPIDIDCFQADALDLRAPKPTVCPDLVITDLPYGELVHWLSTVSDPAAALLANLRTLVAPTSVVAIITDKAQAVKHPDYRRVEHFQIGKRRIVLLQPRDSDAPDA